MKNGYFCAVAEFRPLKEALADWKAGKDWRWTVEADVKAVTGDEYTRRTFTDIIAPTMRRAKEIIRATGVALRRCSFHRYPVNVDGVAVPCGT